MAYGCFSLSVMALLLALPAALELVVSWAGPLQQGRKWRGHQGRGNSALWAQP